MTSAWQCWFDGDKISQHNRAFIVKPTIWDGCSGVLLPSSPSGIRYIVSATYPWTSSCQLNIRFILRGRSAGADIMLIGSSRVMVAGNFVIPDTETRSLEKPTLSLTLFSLYFFYSYVSMYINTKWIGFSYWFTFHWLFIFLYFLSLLFTNRSFRLIFTWSTFIHLVVCIWKEIYLKIILLNWICFFSDDFVWQINEFWFENRTWFM
jgi:hypothetical protein